MAKNILIGKVKLDIPEIRGCGRALSKPANDRVTPVCGVDGFCFSCVRDWRESLAVIIVRGVPLQEDIDNG